MKCDETGVTKCTWSSRKVTIFTCCVPLFGSRQPDDGQCKPVRESCVTGASGQFHRSKDVCSQTQGQSKDKREQFMCIGCLMVICIQRSESYECNKPG